MEKGLSALNENILVVARCKMHRMKIVQTLEEKGYLVHEESVGKMALGKSGEVDAIVLAERMYDMDAVQYLDHLDFLKLENPPKVMLIGSNLDRETAYKMRGVKSFLYPPFYPELLSLKLKTMLHPNWSLNEDQKNASRQLRQYERVPVREVMLTFLTPFHESAQVMDISYSGLRVKTSRVADGHLGRTTKMQIVCQGNSMIVNGKVIWAHDGLAGIRFKGPKPPRFNMFMEGITTGDALPGPDRLIRINDSSQPAYGL